MIEKKYDVVVIGAGIHGAGVAQALAVNGYSVLVLEQNTIASGTSSRSSKLIHGGLRYLENLHLSLVKECLQERTLLLRNAPHLVKLVPFYIPVFPETRRRPWQLRTGLSLYALLNSFHSSGRFGTVARQDWQTLDGLETKNLQKVFRYQDAQTDDVLLTRAVMNSAVQHGAQLMMPCEFVNADIDEQGVTVHYRQNGETHQSRASVVVNAAGPWVNQVLTKFNEPHIPLSIELVQGTHIVLPGELTQGVYYIEAPTDHRAVFVMPWKGNTLVGTTETSYSGDPGQVQPLDSEIDYLLKTLIHYFPHYQGKPVLDSFAGLRVLPHEEGHPFSRSRDTRLITDRDRSPRLLSIYGGKLTAYRITAMKVMQKLKTSLGTGSAPLIDTKGIRLDS